MQGVPIGNIRPLESVRGSTVSLQNIMLQSQPLALQNVTLLGNRVIADVMRDEVTLERDGPLVQYDWCPYNKEQEAEKEDGHVKTHTDIGRRPRE